MSQGFPSQFPQQPQRPNPYGQSPGYAPPPPQSGDNSVGMIAMICGLLSFIMGCPLSIAAIILGFIGMKKEPKGMATAGLVLGIVTLTLNVVVGCFILAIYGLAFGAVAAVATTIGPALTTMTAFETEARELEAHKTANGAYPSEAEGTAMVAGTTDGWGKQILYRMEGEEYVLVSPGPDGILDNDDDVTYYASQYVAPMQTSDVVAGDYAYIVNPTERAISMAVDIVDIHFENSTSEYYPTDNEGQAIIDHLVDEWGNKLVYRQTEGGDSYLVITKGPDGVLDTGDDLNDETYPYAE